MSVIYRELWFVVDNDSHHQSSVSDLLHFPQWEYSHWYHSWRIRLGDTVAGRISPLCVCWLGENFGSSYRAEGETSICESVISNKPRPSQTSDEFKFRTKYSHVFIGPLEAGKINETWLTDCHLPLFFNNSSDISCEVRFVGEFSVFSSSNNQTSQ